MSVYKAIVLYAGLSVLNHSDTTTGSSSLALGADTHPRFNPTPLSYKEVVTW
jgi:hypothetical protein